MGWVEAVVQAVLFVVVWVEIHAASRFIVHATLAAVIIKMLGWFDELGSGDRH